MTLIHELIAQCAALKQKWHETKKIEYERIALERVSSKPPKPQRPAGFGPNDFLKWQDHKEYYEACDKVILWKLENDDLSEEVEHVKTIADEYRLLSLRAYEAFNAIPNKKHESVWGSFPCPFCEGKPIQMPSTQIDSSDNYHDCVCSNDPSHIIKYLPWPG